MTRLPYILLFATLVPAQPGQTKLYDLYSWMHPSLADAKLTSEERSVIYNALDDSDARDSFHDPKEERAAVLNSDVGSIVLAQNGSSQIVVVGPKTFCGSGGCPVRIFVRQNGQIRLVFRAGANSLSISKTAAKGFHDIVTTWRWGFYEGRTSTYRWTGSEYERIKCSDSEYKEDRKKYLVTSCDHEPDQ